MGETLFRSPSGGRWEWLRGGGTGPASPVEGPA